MERPTKCYIRREWVDAVSYLSPELRCMFYEACFSFIYGGSERVPTDPAVKAAYYMVRSTLQQDAEKYNDTCIKNRQNGSNGGRPQGDKTQTNPNKPKQTQKTLNININNSKEKNFFTMGEKEREKAIFLEFFKRGCVDYISEGKKYIDYYSARNWLDKSGCKIIDPIANARVWQIKSDLTPWFEKTRQKWANFVSLLPEWKLYYLTDFVRQEQKQGENGGKIWCVYLKSVEIMRDIEQNHLQQLKMYITTIGATTIQYFIADK